MKRVFAGQVGKKIPFADSVYCVIGLFESYTHVSRMMKIPIQRTSFVGRDMAEKLKYFTIF